MILQYKNAILTGAYETVANIKPQIYPNNKKLYRYRTFDSHWYSNIIKGKVYMSSPTKFNDPFDGNMYGYASTFFREVSNSAESLPTEDFQIINSKGVMRSFADALKKRQDGFKDCFRVACFSEKLDLMTMWAHYASNHSGYVIEYDLTQFTANQREDLYKIAYFSKEELKQADLLIPRRPIFNLLQKDMEWSYEDEWRIIKMRDSMDYEDLSQCVSAVYLGMYFQKQYYEDELATIQDHFKKTGAELREMRISSSGCSLESRPFFL